MKHISGKSVNINNVLVTGASGFVGRYLVPELLSAGYAVRVLTRDQGRLPADWRANPGIVPWEGDICMPATIRGVAEEIDCIIHLAAEGHVSSISEEAFRRFQQVNVDGLRAILEEGIASGVRRFIHFSSTAAMGLIRKLGRVSEEDSPCPVTPYQKSKLASETLAIGFGKIHGLPLVVLRPCMIYGIGGYGEFYKMSRMMRRGLFPKVGLGRNLTPLVHVKDVVQAALLSIDQGAAGSVYLVASERSLPLEEMRSLVLRGWGRKKAPCLYVPVWFMYALAWCFEQIAKVSGRPPLATRQNIASTVWDREFSIEKARRELGFHPSVQFEEGIPETVRWFRDGKR
ncbi:MAG: NAD-dependent epimerase/dehydratase family protein [Desulforudis sp.]|jgi:nucleoside-diphosphate-sugar epimerase|nr:MAG: NAD-dependent epimerase/dehydratase family protein [Desulforudis sp.]